MRIYFKEHERSMKVMHRTFFVSLLGLLLKHKSQHSYTCNVVHTFIFSPMALLHIFLALFRLSAVNRPGNINGCHIVRFSKATSFKNKNLRYWMNVRFILRLVAFLSNRSHANKYWRWKVKIKLCIHLSRPICIRIKFNIPTTEPNNITSREHYGFH